MGCLKTAAKMLLLTIIVVSLFGLGLAEAVETKHLQFGVVMPLSGPLSIIGLSQSRGFQLFAEMVKEQGGLQVGDTKYLIDVTVEDGKGSAEASTLATKKLILQDGAKFVFGAIMETATGAIYDVCARNGALHIISWVNIPWHPADVNPTKPLAVRLSISPHDTHRPDFEYLMKAYPDVKTVALVAPNIGYEPLIEDAKSVAVEQGLEVVLIEKWEWGTEDFVPVYTRVLASKPDVICSVMSGQSHYQLRVCRELGFKGVFISTCPLDPGYYLEVAGPEACTDVICNGMDLDNPTGKMRQVMERSRAKYGDFYSDSFFTWDQSSILIQGMQKAQGIEPKEVLAALESMTEPGSVESVYGPARIGGMKKWGVNRVLMRPVPVCHLMDGRTKFVGLMPVEE